MQHCGINNIVVNWLHIKSMFITVLEKVGEAEAQIAVRFYFINVFNWNFKKDF